MRYRDLSPGQRLRSVHIDTAERPELSAQGLERLPVDKEYFIARFVVDNPNGTVAARPVQIFQPTVGRLQYVAVCIHHGSYCFSRHSECSSPGNYPFHGMH